MKRFMFVLFFALFGFLFGANAQTVTLGPKPVTAGFQIDTVNHKTNQVYTYTVNGQQFSYPIFETPTGSPYVISQGSKGDYPVWIGSLHPSYKVPAGTTLVEGSPLRVSKSGKAVFPYNKANGSVHVQYLTFTHTPNN